MGIDKRTRKFRRNQRYIRNDKTIQKVILILLEKYRGRITIGQVIKASRLSKRTIYSHYPKIYKAPYEIENQLVSEFKIKIKERQASLFRLIPDNNERIFYSLFLHMAHEKDIFVRVCSNSENHRILHRMVHIVYPDLDIVWYPLNAPAPEIGSERVDMYISMCVEILARWGNKTKCDIEKSRKYINRILRLTSEASSRCR